MSWTDAELDMLKARMVEAKRQGAWLSAVEARMGVTLVLTIKRLTMSKGWSGVPQGPLPTIAECRRQGITTFEVHCQTPQCYGSRRYTFEDLGLSDDLVFVEIPRHRRFICRKCRRRDVTVMANFPNALQGTPGRTWSHEGR